MKCLTILNKFIILVVDEFEINEADYKWKNPKGLKYEQGQSLVQKN